jgi:hypothetical protein
MQSMLPLSGSSLGSVAEAEKTFEDGGSGSRDFVAYQRLIVLLETV